MAVHASSCLPSEFQGVSTVGVCQTPYDSRVHAGSRCRSHLSCGTRSDRNSLLAVHTEPLTARKMAFGSPGHRNLWTGCPSSRSLSLRH